MQWLQQQIEELERSASPEVQGQVRQMLQTILEAHRGGLGRMLELIGPATEGGRQILQSCAQEPLIASMLLLHGLHPWDMETRLRWALDGLRPPLASAGARLVLVAVQAGTVRLRLEHDSEGGPASIASLQTLIEETIIAAVPEVERIKIETALPARLIPLPLVGERR
jgi:Fe-S cluster biogenesis protein NfuA